MTAAELANNFQEFGEIREVRIGAFSLYVCLRTKHSASIFLGTTAQGWNKGFGHIEFVNSDSVADVLTEADKNDFLIEGRAVRLEAATGRKTELKPRIVANGPTTTLYLKNFIGTGTDLEKLVPGIGNSLVEVFRPRK